MAETIKLEIVTPERLVVNDTADYIEIPGKTGYFGVLPGHAPLISEVAVGEIAYRKGSETKRLAVAWGFAEVLQDKVTVLAETAEAPSEIDVAAARKAKAKAEAELASADPNTDYDELLGEVKLADTRLEVAGQPDAH